MSDWDFLHDMHNEGYSARDIADAAAVGYAPWQAKYIDFGDESTTREPAKKPKAHVKPIQAQDQKTKALQAIEKLRQAEVLTRSQFLACRAAILK